MRLALIVVALIGCDGCDQDTPRPDLGGGTARVEPPEPAAASPLGRAAAHRRAVPEARERATRRATLLADGRTHARAGRHAEALRAFEDALREVEGPDAALHCEAGHQAVALGQWALARTHLVAGLEAAVQPRRRAACLYDLALVEEAAQDRTAAIAALRESLRLRPNAAVGRKLSALEVTPSEDASEAMGSRAGAESDERGESKESLEALCAPPCRVATVDLPPLPESWPELAFVIRPEGEWMETTWLVAAEDDRWRDVSAIASSDLRGVFGALEASEAITGTRMDDDQLVIAVAGAHDEAPDEAEAYFACEREHTDDDDAVMACFEAAVAELPPAESWSFELAFEWADGRLRLGERRPGPETQVAR